jgi:glycosyltransferase involved in cell wall biosynthesis
MNDNILVSIITVSYNSAKYIRETIDSVLAQQYRNFEYIICDDRSNDNTWEIISEYKDERIKAYKNEDNLGEYPNRNKAISLASGEYLIFIDGDDVMYPHALTSFVNYAQQFPECAILIARDWDERIIYPYKMTPRELYIFSFFEGNILRNFTKLLFKASVIKHEPFPKGVKTGDSYIQLKIAQKHPLLIIPDGLTWWRRRAGNATSTLMRDSKLYAETIDYDLELLGENCPLLPEEVEQAKVNIYGIYLRLLFWLAIKWRFGEIAFLRKHVKVPSSYLRSFFIKRKMGLPFNISGDSPLHTLPSVTNKN